MGNDLTTKNDPRRIGRTAPEQAETVTSRLKRDMMADALGRMFGKDDKKPVAPGTPRVLLAFANHARSPGWERTKMLQRQMFEAVAAVGSGLGMKFASFGEDDDEGVRHFRITERWITNSDDMADHMDRTTCDCGCFVNIRSVLQQAVKENQDRVMRAVVIVGDAFHDAQEGLDEAALAANQLRREGTQVFLIQEGDDPRTACKLQFLERVSGAAYFKFDPKTQQQQFAEMLELVSAYAAGGEEAVKATGGQTAISLLEHLKQPMPIFDEEWVRKGPKEPILEAKREPVRVSHKSISPPKQNR
jgi:hypothetical protein